MSLRLARNIGRSPFRSRALPVAPASISWFGSVLECSGWMLPWASLSMPSPHPESQWLRPLPSSELPLGRDDGWLMPGAFRLHPTVVFMTCFCYIGLDLSRCSVLDVVKQVITLDPVLEPKRLCSLPIKPRCGHHFKPPQSCS